MKTLALLFTFLFSFSAFAFCDIKISRAALAMAKLNSSGVLDITESWIKVDSVSTFTFSDESNRGISTINIEVTSEGALNKCKITKVEIIQLEDSK